MGGAFLLCKIVAALTDCVFFEEVAAAALVG